MDDESGDGWTKVGGRLPSLSNVFELLLNDSGNSDEESLDDDACEIEEFPGIPAVVLKSSANGGLINLCLDKNDPRHCKLFEFYHETEQEPILDFKTHKHREGRFVGLSRDAILKGDEILCYVQIKHKGPKSSVHLVSFIERRVRSENKTFCSIQNETLFKNLEKKKNYVCEGVVIAAPERKPYCFVHVDISKMTKGIFKNEKFKLDLENLFSFGNEIFAYDLLIVEIERPKGVNQYKDSHFNPPVTKAYLKKFIFDCKYGRSADNLQKISRDTLKCIEKIRETITEQNLENEHTAMSEPAKAIIGAFLDHSNENINVAEILETTLALVFLYDSISEDRLTKDLILYLADRSFYESTGLLTQFLSSKNGFTVTLSAERIFGFLRLSKRLMPGISELCDNLTDSISNLKQLDPLSFKTESLDVNQHLEMSLAPTSSELKLFIGDERELLSSLRPVLTQGSYTSLQEYIETYFALLRYDCFYPLMKGIRDVIQGHECERGTNVVNKGKLINLHPVQTLNAKTFCVLIQVHSDQKSPKHRCFLPGMLVAIFGPSSPHEVVWGSVQCRGDENRSRQVPVVVQYIEAVGITFASALQSLISNDGSLIMIEAQTLSAAYCPALKAIREISPDFGFDHELVKAENLDPRLPSIYAKASFNLNHLFRKVISEEQITVDSFINDTAYSTDCRLDNSQYQAMKHMLGNKIAVVQGPPGTGKTYIGVHLTKILLDLHPSLSSPILVMTYKNHALDEFSQSILTSQSLTTSASFLRFGNRSKNQRMNQFALKNIVSRPDAQEINLWKKIEHLSAKVKVAFRNFRNILEEPLDVDVILRSFDSFQLANMIGATIERDDLLKSVKTYETLETIGQAVFEHLGTRKFYPSIDFIMDKLLESLELWLPSDKFTRKLLPKTGGQLSSKSKTQSLHNAGKAAAFNNKTNYDDSDAAFESEKLFEEIFEAAGMRNEMTSNVKIQESDLNEPMIDPYGAQIPECLRYFGPVTETLAREVNETSMRELKDLWTMPESRRLQLVQYLVWKQHEFVQNELNLLVDQLHEKIVERNRMKMEREMIAIGKAKVVAMTVTGAAMRIDLLNAVKPQVIIVEEAAEISEAHLIPLLGNHVKHLVLIGDHKQLRPSVTCFDLVQKCNFDVSMMERLINNNAQFATLATQNRMRPDISKYLRDIYPQLEDHERVRLNAPVQGLAHNCFFWDHDNLEVGGRSFYNPAEAQAVVELVSYLINDNWYLPERITVLSGYQGQTGELRKLMRSDSRTAGRPIDVQTIDMFQGDENDIVIVSLVRNNLHATSGFIGVLNRRCVAQSRGRSGVIFLGNSSTLQRHPKSAKVWTPFLDKLKKDGCFGQSLVINCRKHPDIMKGVFVGEKIAPAKFCNEICGQKMSCGVHTCPEVCSNYHFDHSRCCEQVDFTHACGVHTGKKLCYQDCQDFKCNTVVDCVHFCGHPGQKKCHQEVAKVKCKTLVKFKHVCGIHEGSKKCYQKADDFKCNAPCAYKYHQREMNQELTENVRNDEQREQVHLCDQKCGDEHMHDKCPELVRVFCNKKLHSFERKCYEKNTPYECTEIVQFTHNVCGHTGTKECHQDPTKVQCLTKIDHTCPKCGYHGSKKCHEDESEVQCFGSAPFTLSCGRHKSFAYCFEDKSTKLCRNTCLEKLYPCGDPCKEECMSKHSHFDQKCNIIKTIVHHCGTTLTKRCHQKESDILCFAKCPVELKCGHKCPKTCGPAHYHEEVLCMNMVSDTCPACDGKVKRQCSQSVKDVKCTRPVLFTYPECGHSTYIECHLNNKDNVPKCEEKCGKKLEKCGHACSKVCGSVHDHNDSQFCQVNVKTDDGYIQCNQNNGNRKSSIQTAPTRKQNSHKFKFQRNASSDPYESQFDVDFECKRCSRVLRRKLDESESDVKCNTVINHVCSKCKRSSKLKCYMNDQLQCQLECTKLLDCKHKCANKCFEECTASSDCKECKAVRSENLPLVTTAQQNKHSNGTADKKSKSKGKKKREPVANTSDDIEKNFLEEISQRNGAIREQIERLSSHRLTRVSFIELEPNNLEYLDSHYRSLYSTMEDKTLKFISISPGSVARIHKIVVAKNPLAKKLFLEKQLQLNCPSLIEETLCYYSAETSEYPERYCKVGFHSKNTLLGEADTPITFPHSSPELHAESSIYANILVCSVLIGQSKNKAGQSDSMHVDEKDSNDIMQSSYLIYDPYQIYVIGYVSFNLDHCD